MKTEKPIGSENRHSSATASFCHAEAECADCQSYCKMLRKAGLRPTRQRIALAELMFGKGDRHISAELLYSEASEAGISLSLATVYNALQQFSRAGLLKAISIDSSRTYFDTNTGDHHHFFVEETEEVLDMPNDAVAVANLPSPPEGMEIASVDVVVRVRAKR